MGNKENVIFWTMQIDDTILILLLKLLSQQLSDVFNFQSFCSSWCLCVTGWKWGSQDMWSLLWGFSWPGSFHKYDFDPKLTNFHSVSWVEELWPPVLLELLATVCENWSPRRQGQPEVSAGTSKHQTEGGWMIQHTLVSVHWRHASQWHLSAVRWRPGPVAALRVADDEASACTGSRHQMVPGSQLHLCCCCRGMRLLPQNQLWEGGMPGELLLPLQGGVAPQSDLRPGTSPAPAIASQLCLLLARLWSSGGWFWTEGVPQMFSPHREDGRWQLQPHDLCRYFIIQKNIIFHTIVMCRVHSSCTHNNYFSHKDYIHKPGNVKSFFCSVCGSEFCWLCMKEISDLHYLSPSGLKSKLRSRNIEIHWILLRMHFLGEEALVKEEEAAVAAGNSCGGTSWHCSHRWEHVIN